MAGTTSAPRSSPRRRRLAAAALVLASVVEGGVSRPAGAIVTATIAGKQTGPVVTATSGGVTLTLAAASTAGNLLVATLTGRTNSNFTAPAGWVLAARATRSNNQAEIWYYPASPAISSAGPFTNGGTSFTAGQLSEWSGVATTSPLDRTGTVAGPNGNNASQAVSTSAATTLAGELAVTSFSLAAGTAGTATFTPGTGWSNLGNTGSSSSRWHYTADYRLGVAAGTVSETQTSNRSGTWAAAIATFKPLVCGGGGLTLPAPSAVSFGAVTLTGLDQTKTATGQLAPNDSTGSGSGWNIQGTSTTFTSGGSSLPATATRLTSVSATAGSATCSLPTNSVTYPLTLPAAPTAPPAVKLYNAAASTGGGSQALALNFALTVPANARTGNYSSTWTFSIASGP